MDTGVLLFVYIQLILFSCPLRIRSRFTRCRQRFGIQHMDVPGILQRAFAPLHVLIGAGKAVADQQNQRFFPTANQVKNREWFLSFFAEIVRMTKPRNPIQTDRRAIDSKAHPGQPTG